MNLRFHYTAICTRRTNVRAVMRAVDDCCFAQPHMCVRFVLVSLSAPMVKLYNSRGIKKAVKNINSLNLYFVMRKRF